MPETEHRARRREIEVELDLIRSQLEGAPGLAAEVRKHLQAKQAALEAEREGLAGRIERAPAASQE